MQVIIVDATVDPEVLRPIQTAYAELAGTHPHLELHMVSRPGTGAALADEVLAAYASYTELVDYWRGGAIEHHLRGRLRLGGADLLFAPREDELVLAARLRSWFGLRGQSLESALAFRDKARMKGIAAELGLAVWPYLPVDDPGGLARAAGAFGLPCVVKPRFASGGDGVNIVRTSDELDAVMVSAFEPLPVDYPAMLVVEPLADADYCHVDGLWDRREFALVMVSRYVGGDFHIPVQEQAGAATGSVALDPDDPLTIRIREFARTLLLGFPTPQACAFHLEVWVQRDGTVHLGEVACRLGGNFVRKNLLVAAGVEPDKLWLALECGLSLGDAGFDPANPLVPVAGFRLPYRPGVVRRLPASPPPDFAVSFALDPVVAMGATLAPQEHWWQCTGRAVVTAESYGALPGRVQEMADWLESELIVEPLGTGPC